MVPMVVLFFIGFATFFKLSQGGTLLMKKNLGQKKYGFLFYSQILLHLGYFHMIIFTKGFFGLDILFPFLLTRMVYLEIEFMTKYTPMFSGGGVDNKPFQLESLAQNCVSLMLDFVPYQLSHCQVDKYYCQLITINSLMIN